MRSRKLIGSIGGGGAGALGGLLGSLGLESDFAILGAMAICAVPAVIQIVFQGLIDLRA